MNPDPSKYTGMTRLHVRCGRLLIQHPEYRLGQAYYNAARELLATHDAFELIDGTVMDPFNDDKNVPAFLFGISQILDERDVK